MANLNSFITFVHKTIDSFSSLMIVSHNPGIENFALELIKNKKKLIPEIVYCSNAIRAKQTWELTNRIVKKKENIFYSNDLYMANLNSFITIVNKTIDNFSSLMLVSHNPGIENFALELIKNKKNKFYDNISMKYPTAALAIILFDEKKWSNIKIGTGKIIDFIKPRDLRSM